MKSEIEFGLAISFATWFRARQDYVTTLKSLETLFLINRIFQIKKTVALYPAGPSGAYSPDGGGMGYMMDGGAAAAAAMMHRPPADPMAFHSEYHYPPQYYGHHLWRRKKINK